MNRLVNEEAERLVAALMRDGLMPRDEAYANIREFLVGRFPYLAEVLPESAEDFNNKA